MYLVVFVTAYRQKSDGTLAMLIPKSIQQQLHIIKGMRFVVYPQDDKIVFKLIDDASKNKESAKAEELKNHHER